MKQLIINGTANQYAGLRLCSSARGILHLTDVVQLSVGGCAGCRRRGGGFGERTLQYCVVGWAVLRPSWRSQRYDCGDAKRGRAVCPHIAVNAQAARSTVVARRGRLALPCGHAGRVTLPCGYAGRGALGECALLVLARRSASLSWRCLSIIINKNALNEQNADKIVTVLNKFSYYAKGREAAEEAQKAIAERAKVKVDG